MAKKKEKAAPVKDFVYDWELIDMDRELTPEEQAQVDALVAEFGKRDPNDTEPDDELESLPEFDPDADVFALVIHRPPKGRAKPAKPAKKKK